MAKLPEVFDTNEIEDDQAFAPLPAGTYTARITDSEFKDTKAGTGTYFKLEFTIMGDKFNGRKVWTNLNWTNPNEQAVQIGKRSLKQICVAVGKPGGIEDTSELHGIPMTIILAIKGDEDSQYGPQNVIKRFKTLQEAEESVEEDPFA